MRSVTLTEFEIRQGALAGVDRQISAVLRQLAHPTPNPNGSWEANIVGAIGEQALAKFLGRYPSRELLDKETGDVAGFQVRSTTLVSGALIIKPRDAVRAIFVLVAGSAPQLRFPGWMTAGEARQDRYWRADIAHPAWLVPQSHLHPMESLPYA